MSIFSGVLYGALLFKDEHIFERLAGAATMVFGVVIICCFGLKYPEYIMPLKGLWCKGSVPSTLHLLSFNR